MIDPLTSLAFSIFENRGLYALLLGSGVSRAAAIPTGWEITLDLIRRIAELRGVVGDRDWAAWHRKETGQEPSYSQLLNEVTTVPYERRAILHKYIEPDEADHASGRKLPTDAHNSIAWLASQGYVKVIITTNFDRLIESALTAVGIVPTVISSDDDLHGGIPIAHSSCYLVKVHGDYLDSRIRNTEEELGTYSSLMNTLLDRILDEYGLVVCGWSGDWDPALRAAITRAPNRRFPTFWALRGPASSSSADLISQRAARSVSIESADSFFRSIKLNLSALEVSKRRHPRTVEMVVDSAKQYLASLESKIRLSDLIATEARNFREGLRGSDLQPAGRFSVEELRNRIARYDSLTETLVRIGGIIGRWGNDLQRQLFCDLFLDLARMKVEGGNSAWLMLRYYPAVLLFYAFGLGTLASQNYANLSQWFNQDTFFQDNIPKKLIYEMAHRAGELQGLWAQLGGAGHTNAPLSNYLLEKSAKWSEDYFVLGDYQRLFDTFEVLSKLGYITITSDPETLQALRLRGQFPSMPAGRMGALGAARSTIFSEMASPSRMKELLNAGFGRFDTTFLELALAAIRDATSAY